MAHIVHPRGCGGSGNGRDKIVALAPIVQTERLRLRALREDDLDWLARLHGDPEVMRHVRAPDTREQTARRLAELLEDARREPGLGVWPAELVDSGGCIGWFVLTRLEGGEEIELGFRLFCEHWGRGLATEGARGVVQHAFGRLGLDRLVAVARPENLASHRVLEKVGFTRKGERRVYGAKLAFFEQLRPCTDRRR